MQFEPRPPKTKRLLILGLSLLSGLALMSCASPGRTVIARIPVGPELLEDCEAAIQPADPVTPSAALTFGLEAAGEAKCWKAIALGYREAVSVHNRAAAD